ncbi:MAG: hypothetical protein GY699_25270 [Desulfobacteraceae bacterium]|nr:hypothetical protein [Desulfobacteraceae bacterium]
MAHEYSVQIHDWISKKFKNAKQEIELAKKQNNSNSKSYYNGQLQELSDIRQYLTDQVDLETQKYY